MNRLLSCTFLVPRRVDDHYDNRTSAKRNQATDDPPQEISRAILSTNSDWFFQNRNRSCADNFHKDAPLEWLLIATLIHFDTL